MKPHGSRYYKDYVDNRDSHCSQEGDKEVIQCYLQRDCHRIHNGTPSLVARHQELYDPAKMVISVVGDFDRDGLLKSMEHLTALLTPRGTVAEIAEASHPSQPVRSDVVQEVAQAVVVLGYPGPRIDAPDRYALDVWNGVMIVAGIVW